MKAFLCPNFEFMLRLSANFIRKINSNVDCDFSTQLGACVMLGAFGAHGLKARATEAQLGWWQTATDYFFYHALGLLILALLAKVIPTLPIQWSFWLIQVGILLFSGSLYIMALGLPRGLGAITPIGGALMIAGWLILAWNALKYAR